MTKYCVIESLVGRQLRRRSTLRLSMTDEESGDGGSGKERNHKVVNYGSSCPIWLSPIFVISRVCAFYCNITHLSISYYRQS